MQQIDLTIESLVKDEVVDISQLPPVPSVSTTTAGMLEIIFINGLLWIIGCFITSQEKLGTGITNIKL